MTHDKKSSVNPPPKPQKPLERQGYNPPPQGVQPPPPKPPPPPPTPKK